jgi:hypothetical protein
MTSIFVSSIAQHTQYRRLALEGVKEESTLPVRELSPPFRDARTRKQLGPEDILILILGPLTGTPEADDDELDALLKAATHAGAAIFILAQRGSTFGSSRYKSYVVGTFDTPAELRIRAVHALHIGMREKRISDPKSVANKFELAFSPLLTEQQVRATLFAIANYYRACGGVGLEAEFDLEDILVKEPEGALV